MSNQLNKLINAIVKTKNNNPPRRRRPRPGNRKNGTSLRALPAAYAAHIRPRFSISRRNGSCVVSGCDLIYKIPASITSDGDALFSIIPANPAYWKGTRIGRVAPAYQAYRPLNFKVSYIPQVAVTQSGTIFMGTLWDMAPPSDNLQQSLLTSNGGQLSQCYLPADSTVVLGRNLQQNLFKTTGALDTDTCPFIFCVGVAGANVIPGYLYVTYTYELRNPIGDSWTFINSGKTTVEALPIQDNTSNGSIILLDQVSSLGPGTILDRESDGIYYHGSPVTIPEQTSIYYLNNFQTNTNAAARSSDYPTMVNINVAGVVNGILSKDVIPFSRFVKTNILESTDPRSFLIIRRKGLGYEAANIRFDGPINFQFDYDILYYNGLGITTAYLVDTSITPVLGVPIQNPAVDPTLSDLEQYFLPIPSYYNLNLSL